MFNPKTEKLERLHHLYPKQISQLESLFIGNTNMYIDYANILPWSRKLNWNIDLKRLKQFLDSFSKIKIIKIYNGPLKGDLKSESRNKNIQNQKYELITKPVKIMKQSMDVSSISLDSPVLLEKFIRK